MYVDFIESKNIVMKFIATFSRIHQAFCEIWSAGRRKTGKESERGHYSTRTRRMGNKSLPLSVNMKYED